MRLSLVLLSLLVAFTSCSADEPDPDRFRRLQGKISAAFTAANELNDPRTVAQANKHYGFDHKDDLVAVLWDANRFGGYVWCIESRADDTYAYRIDTVKKTAEYLGDGRCSPEESAAVVVGDLRGHWLEGADLMLPTG
ncbi:MAG TPA: hypothetical protein VLI04_21150 [Nocardioidaceae bacterium]|nr:hypothetical protein [Nocardioidaceae bacterium]